MTSTDRLDPRYVAGSRIRCHLEPHDVALILVNVSRNGFLVRSPMKSRTGDVHRFRFIVESERDAIFILAARVVHCAESVANNVTQYLTSLEFVDTSSPVCQRAIAHLVTVASN